MQSGRHVKSPKIQRYGYREKDRDFVRILLIEEMINAATLIEQICTLRIDDPLRDRLVQWVESTAEEL